VIKITSGNCAESDRSGIGIIIDDTSYSDIRDVNKIIPY